MADSKINIKLSTTSDVSGVRAVNSELAKMAMDVGRSNESLRQSTMLAAREYYSIGDASDKAAKHAILSAKQIEDAWRKAMSKPAEEAKQGFGVLGNVAKGALEGIGGEFKKLATMFMQGGIWGASSAALVSAFKWAWDKIGEGARYAAKKAEKEFSDSVKSISDGAASIEKAFDSSMSGIDKSISRFEKMTNSVKELTKAEIELAKQQAIAGGMDSGKAEIAAADLMAKVDEEAAASILRNTIKEERSRIEKANDAVARTEEQKAKAADVKAAAEAAYSSGREKYVQSAITKAHLIQNMGVGMSGGVAVQLTDKEKAEIRERALLEFDDTGEGAKLKNRVLESSKVLDSIKTDEKALEAAEDAKAKIADAERALDALDAKREARELAARNEIAAKVEEESGKQEQEDKRLADERLKAEVDAAKKAAAERDRLDREAHEKRMADIRAEISERSKESASMKSVASAAKSEFDRAFAMYRDPSLAESTIAEERDYAADYKRLGKDASRYGGKWRIDVLASLMAAGDTQGQAAQLEEWRKSKSFTPQVEAMVRAAAADQTRTTAEDELRKIEANTADLSKKLDELLRVKG